MNTKDTFYLSSSFEAYIHTRTIQKDQPLVTKLCPKCTWKDNFSNYTWISYASINFHSCFDIFKYRLSVFEYRNRYKLSSNPIHIYWKKKRIMNQGVNCVLHVAINPQNAWQSVLRSILSITSHYIALYHWLHHKVTIRGEGGGSCAIYFRSARAYICALCIVVVRKHPLACLFLTRLSYKTTNKSHCNDLIFLRLSQLDAMLYLRD